MVAKAKFHSQRRVIPYVYLRQASLHALDLARSDEAGRFFNLIASMLFTAFCIEGYLNFLGRIEIHNWEKIERRIGRKGRLRKLCDKLSINLDFRRNPYFTYLRIFEFRDLLVHSRVVRITSTGIQEDMVSTPFYPKAKWEKLVSIKNAEKFFDLSAEMIRLLHTKGGFPEDPFDSAWNAQWQIEPTDEDV